MGASGGVSQPLIPRNARTSAMADEEAAGIFIRPFL
jgi:hypothetical protein